MSDQEFFSQIGRKVFEPGFGSTGIVREAGWSTPCFLEIQAPAGTKGAYAGQWSMHPSEHEWLIAPGFNYEIVGARIEGKKHILTVRIVGE